MPSVYALKTVSAEKAAEALAKLRTQRTEPLFGLRPANRNYPRHHARLAMQYLLEESDKRLPNGELTPGAETLYGLLKKINILYLNHIAEQLDKESMRIVNRLSLFKRIAAASEKLTFEDCLDLKKDIKFVKHKIKLNKKRLSKYGIPRIINDAEAKQPGTRDSLEEFCLHIKITLENLKRKAGSLQDMLDKSNAV